MLGTDGIVIVETGHRVTPLGVGIFMPRVEHEPMVPRSTLQRLPALFAVVTLPVGLLAGLFVGLPAAVAVFVVGWLLLVPATAVLFPPEGVITGSGVPDGMDEMIQDEITQSLGESESTEERFDPVEELRQRYARGEIDEQELEQGLDALLETEGVDADDEAEIEQTIDRLRNDDSELSTDAELEGLTDDEDDRLTETD